MASAETQFPPLPAFSNQLRSESRRLRQELLKSQLDLSHTLAKIATETRGSERLRHSCYTAARSGYQRVMKMLGSAHPPSKAIESSAHQLRLTLMRLSPRVGDGPEEEESKRTSVTEMPEPMPPPLTAAIETDNLTRRETEVLKCIAEGLSTKELAQMLGITFKTAACHRERIMDKLNAHSSVVLVRYAIRVGLIRP